MPTGEAHGAGPCTHTLSAFLHAHVGVHSGAGLQHTRPRRTCVAHGQGRKVLGKTPAVSHLWGTSEVSAGDALTVVWTSGVNNTGGH